MKPVQYFSNVKHHINCGVGTPKKVQLAFTSVSGEVFDRMMRNTLDKCMYD